MQLYLTKLFSIPQKAYWRGWCCAEVGKAEPCSASMPCVCRFKPWLLCFLSISLLMFLGKQWMLVGVRGHFHHMDSTASRQENVLGNADSMAVLWWCCRPSASAATCQLTAVQLSGRAVPWASSCLSAQMYVLSVRVLSTHAFTLVFVKGIFLPSRLCLNLSSLKLSKQNTPCFTTRTGWYSCHSRKQGIFHV